MIVMGKYPINPVIGHFGFLSTVELTKRRGPDSKCGKARRGKGFEVF